MLFILAPAGVLEEAEFYNIASLVRLVKERIRDNENRTSQVCENEARINCTLWAGSLAGQLRKGIKSQSLNVELAIYKLHHQVFIIKSKLQTFLASYLSEKRTNCRCILDKYFFNLQNNERKMGHKNPNRI